MNLKKLIAIFLLFPSLASAQWISDIKTESDWEYYFINGYIDYNSYQLLREIAEGVDVEDTSEFIFSTLGISPVELMDRFEISETKKIENEKSRSQKPAARWSGRFRLGNKIQDHANESFLLTSARSGKMELYLKLRNDDRGKAATERRSFKIKNDKYSITLGNFTADIGCGLSLGRFDYRPVSLESDEEELNQFLFPDNSFYNGAKAEFLERHTIIYSVKKYDDVYKNTFGSALSTKLYTAQIGITGSFTRLSSGSGSNTLSVGSIFIDLEENGARGEIAYGESGPGACIQVARPDYVLRGWYYDDSYVNLQSSGFSHPDYQSYTDYRSEISFRQPQRGETGFYARKHIRYKMFEFRNAAEFWRNPRTDYINYSNSFQTRIFVSSGIKSLIRYTIYSKKDFYRNKIESGINIFKKYNIEARVLLSVENESVANEDSRFYVMSSFPLTQNVSLAGRLRWRFNGEFDYFIEDRILLRDRLFLKATYRWKEDLEKDLGSLHVFLENRF
ncbi:MAG: hypothetical protein JSU85_14250 [Candidatus Zixiibacteriota bacterium]|nr:MAG: hypothetical protein JSU85_14250 [candidate division Zixibacteria bacterium]